MLRGMGTINKHLVERLEGIRQELICSHAAGKMMSSATKGREREAVVGRFLEKVLPNPIRFGSGDITDSYGKKSGQLDVVAEYPFVPSFPSLSSEPRLYLAEGVIAVVEVKSNLAKQWNEVENTARMLSPLRRRPYVSLTIGENPSERVPLFAVGFEGWKQQEVLKEKVTTGVVDGALIIESGDFYGGTPEAIGGMKIFASGGLGLFALALVLQQLASSVSGGRFDMLAYVAGTAE
jgi:hypothetical protein